MPKVKPDYSKLGYIPLVPHKGIWHRMNYVIPSIQVVIDADDIAKAVQRRTNYADNASETKGTDNVLVCRHDNKMYTDLLNDALTGVFLLVGKLCKRNTVDFDGDDICFTISARWNYDSNVFQSLAQEIFSFIVLSVVRTWLMGRNSQMFQSAEAELEMCQERLRNLVNWRLKPERRRVDPLL